MSDKQIDQRFERDDQFWTGPKLTMLLGVFLAFAIAFIYFIACVRNGDYVWHPIANRPALDLPIANW